MDCVVALFACFCFGLASIVSGDGGDYCQLETFEGSCPEGKLILMQRARYGRMKLGRCLTRAYYVGCEANVLPQLDHRCSGRRHCHMTIPDLSILRSPTCPQDLVSYLEVDYDCIQGDVASPGQCSINRRIVLQPLTFGYLASEVTQSTGIVGSNHCPWEIVVRPGQRVRLTLIDLGLFAANASATPLSRIIHPGEGGGSSEAKSAGGSCILYATVREILVGGGGQENVVCSSSSRETVVHTSRENRILVVIHTQTNQRRESIWGQIKFLLKYEVVGCADPQLSSPDVYLVRRGERVDVYCNHTANSWHLVCSNTQWVGDYGNCSDDVYVSSHIETDDQNNWQFTYGLWFAVSAGIALGIAVGLGLLLVLYLHRQNRKEEEAEEAAAAEGMTTKTTDLYTGGGGCHFVPPDIARSDCAGGDRPIQRTCALYSCHEDGSTREHYHVRCLYDTDDLLRIQP